MRCLLEQGLLGSRRSPAFCQQRLVLATVIVGPITGQLDFHAPKSICPGSLERSSVTAF